MIETPPRLMTGGEAVAYAMRQIDPDVVPVYPITPQTPIIQGFAKHVADGEAHAAQGQRPDAVVPHRHGRPVAMGRRRHPRASR